MNRTTVGKSDREVAVTRTFDAPARLVFEAWTNPELFKQWWVPRSMGMTLRSCERDVRTGGKYRLVFGDDPANPMAFFGKYLDVVPNQRIVWTNEESGADGSITTVTLEEKNGKTTLVMRDLYDKGSARRRRHRRAGSHERDVRAARRAARLARRRSVKRCITSWVGRWTYTGNDNELHRRLRDRCADGKQADFWTTRNLATAYLLILAQRV